jgi:hypothetical protein
LWASLTVAAVAFVFALGSNCPNADEWEFVPALTHHEPLDPWLWAQHNEHRLPLPRLVYYGLFQLTHDFRAGSLLQIALLSGTSLALMRLAARLRGYPDWTDAFFPVSIVHVGHWENLLIGYNICFAFILVLETAIGVIALHTTRENAFRSGCRAGVLMALLCLCGGGGVVTALPVALWLVYLAVLIWKPRPALREFPEATPPLPQDGLSEPHPGPNGNSLLRAAVLLAFAVFPFLYLELYLQGYHRPGHHPEVGDGGLDVLRVAGQVLSMSFGYGTFRWWPPILAGLVAVGFATLFSLLCDAKLQKHRPASFGLIAIAAGIVGVALVIGMGRAGLDARNGLASRYTYLTWPLIALVFLVCTSRGGRAGKWIPAALCLMAALAFPANMISGSVVGSKVRAVLATVEAEARAGVPPERIVRHFANTFQAHQEQRAIRAMPMLRQAKVGAFAEGRP